MAVHDDSTEADTILEKYQLVTIDGLQSEAGKKLNGGLGIILNAPTDGRYPVRIFALKEGTGFSLRTKPEDKKLKTVNVSFCKPKDTEEIFDVFQKALRERMEEAQQKGDNKTATFWLASSYKNQPEAYHYAFSYSNALSIQGDHAEAAKVCFEFLQATDVTRDPRYPLIYKECVSNFCGAKEHLDKALELALGIPVDTPENKKLSEGALVELANACKKIIVDHKNMRVEEISQYNLQAAQALIKHDPEKAIYLDVIGAAYCLAGNNWEGVKWYRKAIAKGANVKESLIIAQLQCPGMPLEEYYCFKTNNGTGQFVHNSEKHNVKILPGTGIVILDNHASDRAIEYEFPKDPDDPTVFASILERLNSEEREVEFKIE